jgi:hypothetical protein
MFLFSIHYVALSRLEFLRLPDPGASDSPLATFCRASGATKVKSPKPKVQSQNPKTKDLIF